MKKKYFLPLFLALIISRLSVAQDASPPEYLVKQDFPDSVRNLKMLKLNGEEVDFSNLLALHKGKKVIIDFWASWCRDCIAGLPKLEKLKKKTGEEKIVYVFISVDKEDGKWRSAINRLGISGDHYRIEKGWSNTLTNYVGLDWIPRYMVINETGMVVLAKAVVADNEQLEKSLIE